MLRFDLPDGRVVLAEIAAPREAEQHHRQSGGLGHGSTIRNERDCQDVVPSV